MKKRRVPLIELTDTRGEPVYLGALDGLAIPEAVILDMSVEFYGDPAPCAIHRAAVLSRAFDEIRTEIRGQTALACLPARLARYFGAYPAHAVRLTEE